MQCSREPHCFLHCRNHSQLPHVVARLVVAANHDGEHRCNFLTRIVRVKLAELTVLFGHSDAFEVCMIADCLLEQKEK